MARRLTDGTALPVWYQEQCDRVANLSATMEHTTDPDIKAAMAMLLEMHIARARLLEQLMREDLAR